MWVTSSGIPRDTLWTHRTAGMKRAFLNWLLQSQQVSNHRFVCGECWTFSPTISSATLKYKKRCNMGFLIQRAFPSNLQWALLINSSSSRALEIKGREHWPCKNRIQNVSHSTDGAVWSLQSNGCPGGILPKGSMLLLWQSFLLVTDLQRQTWV